MNLSDLPQFERMPLQAPQSQDEKEIFYPKWTCFCCQDYGVINRNLARKIIPNYNSSEDKWPVCQNPNCHAFEQKFGANIGSENFDMRFSSLVCQKLDLIERQNWHNTVQRQVDIRALTKTMAMPGVPDRTDNDNREIEQRKQEVENFDWEAASTAYLGSE